MPNIKVQHLAKMDASTSIAVLVTVSDLELQTMTPEAIGARVGVEVAKAYTRVNEYAKDRG